LPEISAGPIGDNNSTRSWNIYKGQARGIDVLHYREMAFRVVFEVLQSLGITERVLRGWALNKASYVIPEKLTNPSQQLAKQEVQIFAASPYLHLDVV